MGESIQVTVRKWVDHNRAKQRFLPSTLLGSRSRVQHQLSLVANGDFPLMATQILVAEPPPPPGDLSTLTSKAGDE